MRSIVLIALTFALLAGCGSAPHTLQTPSGASLSAASHQSIISLKDRVIAGKPNPVTQIKVMHAAEMNLPTGKKGKRFALNYWLWGKENGKPIGYDRSIVMDCEYISDPDARRNFKTGHRPVFVSRDAEHVLKNDLQMMLLAREVATALSYAEFDQEKEVLSFVAQCLYDEVRDEF